MQTTSTLRQRRPAATAVANGTADGSSSGEVVATRKYYYRHEVSDSDSSDDGTSHSRHRHHRFAWLRRRHFFAFSLMTLCCAYFATRHSPAADYLSDLPEQIAALLPDEFHSQFARFQTLMGDVTRPGLLARDDGIHAHYPVVLIPGIITTALEVWEGEECARPHFRQRLWGSTLMLRSILLDTRCWMRHMMLDPHTGMDPPGIKLRSATGMEAADYLVSGFWVWAKIIENLADIGYDANSQTHQRHTLVLSAASTTAACHLLFTSILTVSVCFHYCSAVPPGMMMAPYDWRLSLKHLQVRDFYYSKLKSIIELVKLSNHNRPATLVTHSMGALVVHYFMQWVESPLGGQAGPDWVAAHIGSVVNIGGPMLGVPKAWSALFSGEMKDTAELAPFLDYWRQRVVFSQADVIQMMRAIFSVPSMLPKGGDAIWGEEDGAPDDYFCKRYADVTKLLMNGGQGMEDIDDALALDYCGIIPGLLRNTSNPAMTDAAIPSSLTQPTATSFGTLDARSMDPSAPVSIPGDVSAGIADPASDAAQQYADGKLQPNPNNPSSYSASLSALLEDSILAHPSRWFTSHKQQQPYESTRHSPRGLFVTFTSGQQRQLGGEGGQGGGGGERECEAEGGVAGCDLTMDEGFDLLRRTAPEYMNFTESMYSFGANPHANRSDPRHWSNPLESPLPNAPDLKIYCFYGVGRETERGYMYRHIPPAAATSTGSGSNAGTENSVVPHWAINSSHTDDARNVRSGVKFTDGDGTVPLVSLGFMCSAGWKGTPLNPANAAVITREYLEVNATMAILRAATSTDHVDIMGNSDVIADLLRVVGVRRKGAVSGSGEGKREEKEKERAREKRRLEIEAENEGRKKEEKGPKTDEQRAIENPPDERAQKGEPEPDTQPGLDESGEPGVDGGGVADEWVATYHEVKDRVLSCVREVSAAAEKRLLERLGVAEWKAAAKSTQTAAQRAGQDPYAGKAPEVKVQSSELRWASED